MADALNIKPQDFIKYKPRLSANFLFFDFRKNISINTNKSLTVHR